MVSRPSYKTFQVQFFVSTCMISTCDVLFGHSKISYLLYINSRFSLVHGNHALRSCDLGFNLQHGTVPYGPLFKFPWKQITKNQFKKGRFTETRKMCIKVCGNRNLDRFNTLNHNFHRKTSQQMVHLIHEQHN